VAHAICLQNWLTVAGGGSQGVQQTNERYADLTPFRDLALYVEISSITGGPTLYLQSSPNREDAYFATMREATAGNQTIYTTSGVQSVLYVRFAATPAARFVRWSAVGFASWAITFRVWLSCNQARGAAMLPGASGDARPPFLGRTFGSARPLERHPTAIHARTDRPHVLMPFEGLATTAYWLPQPDRPTPPAVLEEEARRRFRK
jgi:hypothetical protein